MYLAFIPPLWSAALYDLLADMNFIIDKMCVYLICKNFSVSDIHSRDCLKNIHQNLNAILNSSAFQAFKDLYI